MAQQYYPSVYNGPRYAGQTLGVPYVSAYDPSATSRYVDLMQQEYAKAFSANQALAQRQAEIADIFSYDQEGKEAVLGGYKQRINKIKDAYNQDLALAAPELARAVVEERGNPWYAKNVLYNKEYERRQKLLDQFGPNIQFARDLPQGNLNDIEMEDIGFEYLNKALLDEMLQREYGHYAKQTRTGNPQVLKDFPMYAELVTTKGLTPTEAASLTQDEINEYALSSLQGSGVEASPELADLIRTHAGQWAQANLVGGYDRELKQVASLSGSGSSVSPALLQESNLVKVDEVSPDVPTRREAVKSGQDLFNRLYTGQATYEEEQLINSDPELKKAINEAPIFTSFTDSVTKVMGEERPELTSVFRAEAENTKDQSVMENTIREILLNEGTIEQKLDTYGVPKVTSWNGEKITHREFKNKIKPLVEDYKRYNNFDRSTEGKQLAKAINAQANPPMERGVYALSDESQESVQQYFNDVILSTDAENLASAGVYIEKRSGKDLSQKRSSNKIEDLQAINTISEIGRIKYLESGIKGDSPELIVDSSEGTIHIPLKGEQGMIHGMELSVRSLDPKIINDTFRALYDKQFSEAGGAISVGEAFGDKDFKIPGMDKIYRSPKGGSVTYEAPIEGTGKSLYGNNPAELYSRIAIYVNRLPQDYKLQVNNPTLQFLIRRYSDLLTNAKKSEAVLGEIANIIANQ